MVGLPVATSRNPLAFCIAIFLCALALAVLAHAARATDVTADITVDTVWAPAGSPYMLKADVTVKTGATLRIMPGTEVKFAALYGLLTEGTGKIEANGRADSRILFTSGRVSPVVGDWDQVTSGVRGIFRNCTFSYATVALQLQDFALVVDGNFTGVRTGVYVQGAQGTSVRLCEVNGANVGIGLEDAQAAIVADCQLTNCPEGITMTGSTAGCTVVRCTVTGSTTEGIGIQTTGPGNRVTDCTISTCKKGLLVLNPSGQTPQGDLIVTFVRIDMSSDAGIELNITPTQLIQVRRCISTSANKGILLSSATNVQVTECTFKLCTVGARVENCKLNTTYIWKNNFIDCIERARSTTSISHWDKDGKGNFWGGFAPGQGDQNGDGIWDYPYSLTGTQKDNFPLVNPVDFDPPVASAGPSVKVKQHRVFSLDGSASADNTWVENWTWKVPLPGGDHIIYGAKPSGTVDIAGVYTVTLTVTDPVGLRGTATTILNVTDADPPVLLNVTTPDTAFNGRAFNFSARVSDNTVVVSTWVMYRFGTGNSKRLDLFFQGDGVWAAEIFVPGDMKDNLYYTINAKDRDNNVGKTMEFLVPIGDDIPPELTPQLPDHVTTGDECWLNCSATDNRGVLLIKIEYWFLGGEHVERNMSGMGVAWSLLLRVPLNASSPLTLIFNGTDLSGNHKATPEAQLPVRDNDRPILNLDMTDTRFHYGMPAALKVMMSDNIGITEAFVDIRYSSTEWESTPMTRAGAYWTASVPISAENGHLLWFRYRALDAAGNEMTSPEVDIELLSQNPNITVGPSPDAFEGRPYSVRLTATDPDTASFELLWAMDTNATWLNLDPSTGAISGTPDSHDLGVFWINVTVSDGEGGSSSLRVEINVHDVNNPPSVTITSPTEDGIRVGSILKVVGRAEDDDGAITWVRVRIDQGEWENVTGKTVWSYEVQTAQFAPGRHYVDVQAFDGFNESDVKTISFLVPEKAKPDDGPGFGVPVAIAALVVLALAGVRARRRG